MTKTKWNRSEDGNVRSKDGRFEVEALFCGCETAQCYRLADTAGSGGGVFDTQRDAKHAADNVVTSERMGR
jgi:hypothetical protein